jgi:helicase
MKLADALEKYNFPKNAQEVILSAGIKKLYPPQAEAVKKGLLSKKSLLMSVPTAAGKTLMAELCMLRAILQDEGRCLYIAPLKALASEKYRDLKEKYKSLGIKVGLAIGDADSRTQDLSEYQILVATAEKVDSLLRSKAQWLIKQLSVAVMDEIHFINDGSRGPTMEILIARIKQLNPEIQILGLSATVSNADAMAEWIGGELVSSPWRPIPLKEGVYCSGQIEFHDHGTRIIEEEESSDVNRITLDTLRGKGQVLIFVGSRRSAQAVGREVCKTVAKVLTKTEKEKLLELSKKIIGKSSDATKICQALADAVKHGSAFHHAGLKPRQRELVEENFKANLIKVISCTPTLAAGVNLPARRAIIRDVKRFEAGLGSAYIPTSEYKQCAGRAGRPQFDKYGEAVLIAKNASEVTTLFEKYIEAEAEPIISKLDNKSSLRTHILSSVASGYVHDINSMFEFISHTFLYHQRQSPDLFDTITDIFDFLHREEFIQKSGYRFFATPFGSLTSRLYIDPISSLTLREGLKLIPEGSEFSAFGILHMLSCCPDGPKIMNSRRKF